MEKIGKSVYIEESYPGVTLGVLALPKGVMMIDAPFRHEDVQSWRGKLGNIEGGVEKLLVILDTHIDRMLGVPAMGCNTLCHETSIEILQSRSGTIRAQDLGAGSDFEKYDQPTNIQWAIPKMTYTDQVLIYWDDDPIRIIHQPGSHVASSWVQFDADKVIFIGDSVILNQPPFIGWSDLNRWIEALQFLRSETFKGYKIVAGRDGLVNRRAIGKMITFLMKVDKIVQELFLNGAGIEDIRSAASNLLKYFDFDQDRTNFYLNRLALGIENYLHRHCGNDKGTSQGAQL